MASVWSCVTYTVVMPSRRCMRAISVRICPRSLASRLDSGSSNRKASALRTIARPIATRWRWPPERLPGLRWRWSPSSSISAAAFTRRVISSLDIEPFASRSGKAMFSKTDMCGYSA